MCIEVLDTGASKSETKDICVLSRLVYIDATFLSVESAADLSDTINGTRALDAKTVVSSTRLNGYPSNRSFLSVQQGDSNS